jgi:hypothetical protein
LSEFTKSPWVAVCYHEKCPFNKPIIFDGVNPATGHCEFETVPVDKDWKCLIGVTG